MNRKPIYQKIEKVLEEEIIQNELDFLSESYIIQRFKVSNTTARKVLDRLEEKDLVERKVGIGSIVVNREKVKEIGILFLDIFHPDRPFISQIIKGIEKEAKKKEYHLHLYTTRGKSFLKYNTGSFYHLITRKKLDGVIILSPISSSDIVFLKKEEIPLVITQNYYPSLNIPTVLFDYKNAVKKICRIFKKKGYKKIGIIAGPRGENGVKRGSDFVKKGYKEFLKENGVPFHKELFQEREYAEKEGYKAMEKFYSLPDNKKPDFLLIFSSLLTTGAKKFLEKHKDWQPGIVSFLDEKSNEIDGIFTNFELLGKYSFKLLEKQIMENRIIPEEVYIPLEIRLGKGVKDSER